MAPSSKKKVVSLDSYRRNTDGGVERQDAHSVKTRLAMRQLSNDLRRRVRSYRADGWANALTNLGVAGRDKRLAGRFQSGRLADFEAEDIWRGDDMAARAVEAIPEQIIRGGWETLIQTEEAKPKSPEQQRKKARVDFLRSSEGTRWWLNQVSQLKASPEAKAEIIGKIRADLAADVFPEPEVEEGRQTSKEMAEAIDSYADELGVLETVGQVLKEERGYGGSALLPGVVDGQNDLRRPLDYERIRSVDWMDTLTPLELIPYQWYQDPASPNFGKPELYWMQRLSQGSNGIAPRVPIHESRLIIFPGQYVSRRQLNEHWGWGDSILVRMEEVLRDFQTGWQGAAILLQEFSQLIISIKGLSASFGSGEDDLLVRRAQAFAEGKSIANAAIIDSEEKAERQSVQLSGLADLLDRFCNRLAASASTPVTILMGQAPAGLNATGASDIRSWYDTIGAGRERRLKPKLRQFYKMLFAASEGPTKGNIPDKWSIKFGPLYQLTEQEEAQRRYTIAQADNIYIMAGVLLPEEVAISRFGGDTYSIETQLNRDVREQADEKAEEEAAAHAEQMQLEQEAKMKAAEKGVPPTGGGKPGGFPPKKAGPPGKPNAAKPGGGNPFAKKDGEQSDGFEDVPRDESGRWVSGGGTTKEKASEKTSAQESQSASAREMLNRVAGTSESRELEAKAKAAAKQMRASMKEKTVAELHELMSSRLKQNGARLHHDPEYVAASKEMKARGVTTFSKLAVALTAEKDALARNAETIRSQIKASEADLTSYRPPTDPKFVSEFVARRSNAEMQGELRNRTTAHLQKVHATIKSFTDKHPLFNTGMSPIVRDLVAAELERRGEKPRTDTAGIEMPSDDDGSWLNNPEA